jgi:pimeloyl-ACP methyl ester carboxylesterase
LSGAVDLARERFGEGAPALLVVHGLFGSGRNWGAIARRLADARRVVTVDMRNHAGSPWAASHTYADLAADLAAVIAAEGAPMDVLGHSMGGKAAMRLALERADLVGRLIVADIAPVAYGHTQAHLIAAMRGLDLAGLHERREADARLALAVADPGVRAFLLQSLDLRAQPPRWRLNLDALEAEMPAILGWPDPAGLPPFNGKALFLAGGQSDYVRPEHRPAIRALFPQAVIARIPGAGHWLHAEQPRAFEAAVRAFLA